ncbi:hypothetical protein [Spongorhabdus nitratireducens]
MTENILIIVTVLFFVLTLIYELVIRAEAKKYDKKIDGLSYITFGLIAIPMFNIMTFKTRKISGKAAKYGFIFSLYHYFLIAFLAFYVSHSY